MLVAMSWETVDSLPGPHRAGSSYRSVCEPVVAKRSGLTPVEKLRLLWLSTPELPFTRAAARVVLTPGHLYVERVDGTRQRIRLDALKGRRVDGPRLIYGVLEGEDLELLSRASCPVITELDARFRETTASELTPVLIHSNRTLAWIVATLFGVLGLYFLMEYSLESMWDRIHRGLYTAEVVLGVTAGAASMLAAVLVLAFLPVRIEVDTLGVRRVRGMIPWLHYLETPETFHQVRVDTLRRNADSGVQRQVGFVVRLRFRGDPEGRRDLNLQRFIHPTLDEREAQSRLAGELANRVGCLLDLKIVRGA